MQHVLRRGPTERDDHLWPNDLDLPLQIRRASCNFIRRWLAVGWGAAFDDVRYVYLLAPQAHAGDHGVEQLPGAADERAALLILIFARAFADEEDLCVRIAFAEDRVRALLAEAAARAAGDFILVELVEALDFFVARQRRRSERIQCWNRDLHGLFRQGFSE